MTKIKLNDLIKEGKFKEWPVQNPYDLPINHFTAIDPDGLKKYFNISWDAFFNKKKQTVTNKKGTFQLELHPLQKTKDVRKYDSSFSDRVGKYADSPIWVTRLK